MNTTRKIIEQRFRDALKEANAPEPAQISDETALLQSGLDSLGFAILVSQLENELGYDPFTLMEEAVYPSTFGEFVGIYEKYAPRS